MTDSFGASIEGYRDWLPYSGKRKGASTIRQYTRSAEQLAAWAREQGRQGFGELSRADLRAFLNTLHGRGRGPPSVLWKSAVWYGIKSLFGYLADVSRMKTSRSSNRTAQSAEATPHYADPGTFRPLLRGRLRCGGLGWTVAGVPPGSALETAIGLTNLTR